jgi:hypothetical protein
VVAEPLAGAPDYVAVEIAVDVVDDHRQAAFQVTAGVDRSWLDEDERNALGARVGELRKLAGEGS